MNKIQQKEGKKSCNQPRPDGERWYIQEINIQHWAEGPGTEPETVQGLPVIGPGSDSFGPGPWSDSYTGYSAEVGERKPGIVEREKKWGWEAEAAEMALTWQMT